MSARQIVIRSIKTAVQTFLAVLVASGTGYVHIATIKGAAIAAGAALLSALNNALVAAE
jgi:hypothetical protein